MSTRICNGRNCRDEAAPRDFGNLKEIRKNERTVVVMKRLSPFWKLFVSLPYQMLSVRLRSLLAQVLDCFLDCLPRVKIE